MVVSEEILADKPRIIVPDCSGAHEFDDGGEDLILPQVGGGLTMSSLIAIAHPLELYKSGVYDRTTQVIERGASIYNTDGPDGESYHPMLAESDVFRYHLDAQIGDGDFLRRVMGVSFVVGETFAPTDVQVGSQTVIVEENLTYDALTKKAVDVQAYDNYLKTAALLAQHLNPKVQHWHKVYRWLTSKPKPWESEFSRGSKAVEIHMIAANVLVGRLLAEEGWPVINRRHDPDNSPMSEFLPPERAFFSLEPGIHVGLGGLEHVCRVTSPLRRAEDFMMHGILAIRDRRMRQGKPGAIVNVRDTRLLEKTVRRRNQMIVQELLTGTEEAASNDSW